MSTNIRFPQGPIVDQTTGMVSLEWFEWFQNPQVLSIDLGNAVAVTSGGTGLTSGTSGGVLAFTASDTLASSGALGANRLVLGGGAGAVPSTPVTLGTTTTVLHGNAAGAPTWAAVSLTADVSGALPLANGGTNATLTAANGGVVYSTASALAVNTPGSSGNWLKSAGASAPVWTAPAALTKTDDTNVTLTLGGSASTALLNAASLTLGWTGQLGLSRGGTNANLSATGGTSQVLKQSSAGAAVTVGQLAASDLSDYATGTFTPGVAFGGGTTGVTYTAQVGQYTRIGNRCYWELRVFLSSKGTDTGNATFTGLPFTSKNTSNISYPCSIGLLTSGFAATVNTIHASVTANATTGNFVSFAAGARTTLTDADFTDTTSFSLAGHFPIEGA